MSSDDEPGTGNFENIDENADENNEILEIGEDLQEPEENTEEVQRDETADGDGEGGDKLTVKAKRVVRNPRPKLNDETLKGPRGIAALPTYFERVKFKGKGHEKQDLNAIMKTYEYWCHRLFPKYPFDTCIEKIERLGKKKAVQTHIKRIRFDLLVEDKPIIDSSDEEANVDGFVDITNEQINQQNQAKFDQISPQELTDEQKEKIRLNKEKAERLRAEKLKKVQEKTEENLEVPSQLPSTSGMNLVGDSDMESVGDVLSQKEAPSFDMESNVKGKARIGGSAIKKRGAERQENKENIENEASMDAEEFQNDGNLNGFADSDKENQVKSVENSSKKFNRIDDSDEEVDSQNSQVSQKSSQKNNNKLAVGDSYNEASNVDESSNDSLPSKMVSKKGNKILDSDSEAIETPVKVTEDPFGEDRTKKVRKLIVSDEDSNGSDAIQSGLDEKTRNNVRQRKNVFESDESDQEMEVG